MLKILLDFALDLALVRYTDPWMYKPFDKVNHRRQYMDTQIFLHTHTMLGNFIMICLVTTIYLVILIIYLHIYMYVCICIHTYIHCYVQ